MAGEAGARPGGSCRKRSTLSTLENKENRAVIKAKRQLSSQGDDAGKVSCHSDQVYH